MNLDLVHNYDYIFCGAGASAGLLMISMHESGLLKHKRILIIEKEIKTRRDKTFCFWSQQNEPIETSLREITSHTWHNVTLPQDHNIALHPFRYNHVSSLDLYRKIEELSSLYHWDRLVGDVRDIQKHNDSLKVYTDEAMVQGKLVFDSRTPDYFTPQKGESHLLQSFIGWHIQLHEKSLNPDSFRFMDFDLDQGQSTQFVYTLPYSDGTILVELTRFGKEIIKHSEAEALLDEYILRKLGHYIKIDEEQGCIPMSSARLKINGPPEVIQLGARNYNVKPSTGYAFKNMYYHARRITQSIQLGQSPSVHNQTHSTTRQGRFAFYDSLLLDILAKEPQQGKHIFSSLFLNTETPKILNFLDEETSLREEVTIFSGLPITPFLKSLWRRAKISDSFRPIILTILCILLIIPPWELELSHNLTKILLLSGLVLIGIPHGAVDHLLETKSWNYRKAPVFIFKYIALGLLMACVWFFLPTAALLLFLLYSAWHFGQADGVLWRINKATSFLWGGSLLLFILGTHLIETNSILSSMGTIVFPASLPWWLLMPWSLWFLSRKNYAALITTGWIMLSSQIPLMFAFGLYFIGQHSFNGWQHVKEHLQMSHTSIWLHSLPFHAGAWILLGIFFLLRPITNDSSSWGIFFIFLACLSLPHVLAMQRMYRDFSNS